MMDKQFLSCGYDRQTFARFLDDFLPDDFVREQKSLDMSGYKQNFLSEATRLGKCKSLDLEVYEVRHTSLNDARVGISRDAFNLLLHHSFCNRALIAFVPSEGEQWRFSLLEMSAEVSDTTNRIKRSYSNPRRFSFLLGRGAKTKTPEQYIIEKGKIHERAEGNKPLSAWDDLKSRFSVEVLTKEFYDQLFHWFLWAIDSHTGVTFPNRTETADDDYEQKPERIIRLITRLLFVWFIKQKNLIPDDIFEPNKLKNILSDFQPESSEVGTYYNAILQNLFFATLNQEINDRKFINDFKKIQDKYSVKSLYRDDTKQTWFRISHDEVMKLFHRVPYMNSALFECLDIFELTENNLLRPVHYFDGFSSNGTRDRATGHYKYRAFIPDSLFFSGLHEETVTLDPSSGETIDIKVQGIINIFKEYNFTIEENTPADVQVSLDPELLGRVFENLLAAYNPETGTTARKATGSFYTPREIVDYMVEESLVAHLSSTCGTEHTDTIRALVKHNEIVEESNAEFSSLPAEQIISSLKTLRILDPACGSGAFPMGCLLKICSIIETLQPENHDRYQTKLDIIKSCIYGVDIQPIAMMISKLRFFISLLCEQEPKLDDEVNNYGIDPLPNLDTKFVAANSLISPDIHKYKGALLVDDDKLNELNDELLEIRNEYVTIRTKSGKKNNRLREEAKRNEIEQYILVQSGAPDQDKIARLQQEIAKNEAELPKYQGEKIVETKERIQNLFGDVTERVIRKDINKEKRDQLTAAIRRCQQEIQREKNKQNPVGFAAAVQQVTKWNPFDQNQTSPYFDPEWMFGIHGGFDIVIGNPPYVQLRNDGGKYASLYEPCGYETFARTGDMYCLFYERGWQNLKAGGRLCYITSNKWMRAGYGEKTREFFANKTNPQLLIDFAGVKIFESATVDTNILLFEKSANTGSTLCCIAKKLDKKGSADLSLFVQQNSSICDFHTSDSWVILSPIEQSIKRKIEAVGTPLKDWDIQINYGIKTGFNDAFIISTEKRNQLLAACKSVDERKRTEELIRPILRGRDIKRYSYDWANLWLVNVHNGIKGKIAPININDYPTLKRHLDSYWDKISNRDDQGVTPYNLRNCAYLEDFFKPKIVYGQFQDKAEYSFAGEGIFLSSNEYMLIARNYSTKCLLAFLNSKSSEWLLGNITGNLGGNAKIGQKSNFVKLSIPVLKKQQQMLFEKKVDEILTANKNGHDYSIIEHEIDQMIYELYGLTNEEIAIVESI